jgi:hypothetical protein
MGFLPVEEADGTISKIVVREFFLSVPSRSGRRPQLWMLTTRFNRLTK